MKSIRIITRILLVFFALFLVMNCMYVLLAWYRHTHDNLISIEMRVYIPFIVGMNAVYFLMHIGLYVGSFLFLIFCNRFVRKNQLGKGVHFMLILVGFFPVVIWILRYIIWLKLNKNIYTYFKTSSKASNLQIVLTWILSVGSILFFLIASFWVIGYSSSPEMVTSFEANKNLIFLVVFISLTVYSVTAFVYYWNFLKLTKRLSPSLEQPIGESQLLDN